MKDKKIIYTFNSWEDYDDLMQYLESKGATWYGGRKPTKWHDFIEVDYDIDYTPEGLVIFLNSGKLTYEVNWAVDSLSYNDYKKIHWVKDKGREHDKN